MNITVYGTPVCPHCNNVKAFLENKHMEYDYKTVGADIEPQALEEQLGRPVRTVPVIVVDGDELSFDTLKLKVGMSEMSL